MHAEREVDGVFKDKRNLYVRVASALSRNRLSKVSEIKMRSSKVELRISYLCAVILSEYKRSAYFPFFKEESRTISFVFRIFVSGIGSSLSLDFTSI